MKRAARLLLAEVALPAATYARRKLMELEGWLIRVRYLPNAKIPPKPVRRG